MKVDVIALQGFGITKKGGRARIPRDHAKVLVQMGLAKYAEEEEVPALVQPKTYLRRDMTAAPTRAPAARPAAPLPPVPRTTIYQPPKPTDDGKA